MLFFSLFLIEKKNEKKLPNNIIHTHTQTDSIFNPSYEIEPRKALDYTLLRS